MESRNPIEDKFTIDELLHRSWKHKGNKEFFKFFDFIASFHHYSRFNTMLVYLQNEAVTFFGGTSFWKKRNRTIKEDARPYVILAPMGPVMMVYDVMDTEGKLSPQEYLDKGLGGKPFEVTGEINPVVLKNAIQIAKSLGINIKSKPQDYFKGGHITITEAKTLEIVLNSNSTPELSIATLTHELAHLFLGHLGYKELISKNPDKKIKLLERNKLTRTAEELEAETVSFLICKKFGLDTSADKYIASYLTSEDDLLKFSYESVIKMADKIEDLFFRDKDLSSDKLLHSTIEKQESLFKN